MFALTLALTAPQVFATPYEVLYDANTPGVFPEDLGWDRYTTGGGAIRTVEDGLLKLDGFASRTITDQYLWDAMETLDPGPGELFYAEWRMRVLPGSEGSDIDVFIATDGGLRDFNLLYSTNGMRSSGDGRQVFMDMTVFHTFRLESLDMIDYAMFIDGQLAWEGFFASPTIFSSWVIFGDGAVGATSGSHWDYFKFGVRSVPAPSALLLLIPGALIAFHRRKAGCFTLNMEDRSCIESQHFW